MDLFNEPEHRYHTFGWIEVICGSMFSGKTEELMRRLKRAKFAKQSTQIFKPLSDTRYSNEDIISHDHRTTPSIPVTNAQQILLLAADVKVIGIDEAQFFSMEIIDVVNLLANQGKRVIVAGLDMDFTGKPFGPMPYLMAIAEYVTKLHAICSKTGEIAHYSFRKVESDEPFLLGEQEIYTPLSRKAYLEAMEERKKKKEKN